MRLTAKLLGLGLVALAAQLPAAAAANEESEMSLPSAQALDAVAAQIPEQEWYPEGYYDVRVAFAADFPEAERMRVANYIAHFGGTAQDYYGEGPFDQINLGDCDVEDLALEGDDPLLEGYVWIARDMTYFGNALERGGFPASIYQPILLAYERRRLAELLVQKSGRDESTVDFASEFGIPDYDADTVALTELLDRLNAARTGEHANLPEVIMADGCGGESPPVILRTAPGNGQVWLISTFAFRVCTRRNPDPWDKFACRWNEVETGAENSLAGRYVYEVVWPDGTSRRGTREIRGDVMTWEPRTVTFRKTGS